MRIDGRNNTSHSGRATRDLESRSKRLDSRLCGNDGQGWTATNEGRVPFEQGFTLLEVMVALSILSLGIVTVLQLFSGSLQLGVKASRHTQAAIYAQNVMDRIFAQTRLENGEDGGEFPGGYSWRARVEELRPDEDQSSLKPNRPNPMDLFHLKEIEVQIRWEENGGPKVFALKSLRTQIEQSENALPLPPDQPN